LVTSLAEEAWSDNLLVRTDVALAAMVRSEQRISNALAFGSLQRLEVLTMDV
jgi:hypothetical protein